MSGCPESIQNITVNRLAQEIVLINKRTPDYRSNCAGDDWGKTTVDICEVKVMGKNHVHFDLKSSSSYSKHLSTKYNFSVIILFM